MIFCWLPYNSCMLILTLFEHQFLPYSALGLSATDPFCAAVDRLNAAAGREILQAGRTGLRAGAWVGVVRVGPRLIEILPKIDYQSGDQAAAPPAASAAHNLLALLAYAADLPLRALAPAGLRARPGGWTGLLTALFAASLRQALAAGPAQAYVEREDCLPVLRGRWDLPRQARQPLPAGHCLAVTYADYSADTPLNQVLRLAVEDLLPVTSDRHTLGVLADLRARLWQVSLRPDLRAAPPPAIVFDRQSEPFRVAYQLASLFLAGSAVMLRAGPLPAFAFVFDMNRLFERFTAGFLARHQAAIWPPGWEGVRLLAQHSLGAAAYLASQAGRPVLRVQPDLCFTRAGSPYPLLVADTKYKQLGPTGAPPEDVYQMLAYLLRLNCPRGLLLYPQPAGSGPIRRVLAIDPPGARPVRILVASLNLRVPLDRPDGVIKELREMLGDELTDGE